MSSRDSFLGSLTHCDEFRAGLILEGTSKSTRPRISRAHTHDQDELNLTTRVRVSRSCSTTLLLCTLQKLETQVFSHQSKSVILTISQINLRDHTSKLENLLNKFNRIVEALTVAVPPLQAQSK